jgi:hypothetical protein
MDMSRSGPLRIAILALMLVVSHVALISHVTAHFEPQLGQCELCVSQGQLLTAITSPDHGIPFDSGFGILQFDSPQCAIPVQHRIAFRQRAPPVPSP